MYQSNRSFNIPTAILQGISRLCLLGGGGGEDLNSEFDFVLRVPVIERGLISHGGGRYAVRNGQF